MELIIFSIQVIHVIVSVLLIIVVLLQPGKGGDLGSVFGGGGGGGTSESVFGAAGAVPFLSKVTRVLAVLFLLSSLTLGYFAARNVSSSVVSDIPVSQQTTDIVPATDAVQPDETQEQTTPAEVSEGTTQDAPADTGAQVSDEPDSSKGIESQPTMDSGTQEGSQSE